MAHTQQIEQWEVEEMSASAQEFYPDHLEIRRAGGTADDEWGGRTPGTPTVIATDVPCYLNPGARQEHEQIVMAKIDAYEMFVVEMPPYTDVKVDDVLVILSQGGKQLTVRAVFSPESYEVERRVIAVR